MSRPAKRPSSRHEVPFSDAHRVPLPTLERHPDYARYVITPLGHVFRDDGRLMPPREAQNGVLQLRLCGNKFARSLPLLVFNAFAHPKLIERWHDRTDPLSSYDPWLDRFSPRDPLTNMRRCTVHDVKLVPHAEIIRYGRYSRPPRTRLSILELPR